MDKKKNDELSRMFQYAGKYHGLTILGCVLSGISTISVSYTHLLAGNRPQLRTDIPGSASRRPLFDRQRIHGNRCGGREIFENNRRDAALHAGAIKGAVGGDRLHRSQAASSIG